MYTVWNLIREEVRGWSAAPSAENKPMDEKQTDESFFRAAGSEIDHWLERHPGCSWMDTLLERRDYWLREANQHRRNYEISLVLKCANRAMGVAEAIFIITKHQADSKL